MAVTIKRVGNDKGWLRWLVNSRAETMRVSLELYALLSKQKFEGEQRRRAQRLAFVSFSLWRAVFLADRKADDRMDHALGFLKRMIEDNAIAYTQDKQYNAWTFRYYADTAIIWLNQMPAAWVGEPIDLSTTMSSRNRWMQAQDRFASAVEAFRREAER